MNQKAIARHEGANALPELPPDIDDYMAIFYDRAAVCQLYCQHERDVAEREAMRHTLATHAELGLREAFQRRQHSERAQRGQPGYLVPTTATAAAQHHQQAANPVTTDVLMTQRQLPLEGVACEHN